MQEHTTTQNDPSFRLNSTETAELVSLYESLKFVKTRAFTLDECREIVANNDKATFGDDRVNWLKSIQQHDALNGAQIAILLFEFYYADDQTARSHLLAVWQKLVQKSLDENIDQRFVAMLWRQMGMLETSQGHFQNALDYFQKSTQYFLNTDNRMMLGNDYFEIGLVFRNMGDYHNAWAAFEASIKYAQQAENYKTVIYSRGQLANLLAVQSRFAQAIDMLKASLDEWENFSRAEDRVMRHTTLNTLGRIYLQNGQFQMAKDVLLESLRLKESINERFDAIIRTRSALAEACIELGEFDEAEKYLQETDVDKLVHMGSYLYAASALKTLSQLHYAKKNFVEFERLANRSVSVTEHSNNPLTLFGVLLWVLPAYTRRLKLVNLVKLTPPFVAAFFRLKLSPMEVIRLMLKRLAVASKSASKSA